MKTIKPSHKSNQSPDRQGADFTAGKNPNSKPLPHGRGSDQKSARKPIPLAYHITFSCYGARLHGDQEGSVDRDHNAYGTPLLPPGERLLQRDHDRMDQPAYEMDTPRRTIVLKTIEEVCSYRGWDLLAAHVRTNHVHSVIRAEVRPDRIMSDLKSYASRRLKENGFDDPRRKRWSHHGSTRYLWTSAEVEATIQYVVDAQGEPMAVYDGWGTFPGGQNQKSERRP